MPAAWGIPGGCLLPVVAGAVVLRGRGDVLLVRQIYGRLRGCWGLPTGFVGAGEAPEAAALREVREEAGIEASATGLLALCTLAWSGRPALYAHLRGEAVPDGSENDAARYLCAEDPRGWPEPLEPLSARLAQRAVSGSRAVLPPTDISALDPTYRVAFMGEVRPA